MIIDVMQCQEEWRLEKGNKVWRNKEGDLHREDGPAIEYANGRKEWWFKNDLHRINGPAIEFASGRKEWYLNGRCHREDGPAIECPDGDKFWYIEGDQLTEEAFNSR